MKILRILLIVASFGLFASCQSQQRTEQPIAEEAKSGLRILTDDEVAQGAERMELYLPQLVGKRVGMVVNQTSMVGKRHLVDTLIARDISLMKIFAPEHGFRGQDDAGAHVEDGIDTKTNLPIISLYGKSKKPSADHLSGLDVVIFDIQDVGARFYTYLSSMHLVMEACAENNVEFILMDRPNPNGFYVDGPVLDLEFSSFVGMHEIPIVHGMTFGELANMIKGEQWANLGNLNMTIISCLGYDHESTFDLPIKPSPNLPNLQSILLYPSLCLFEPTDYSIGRGTQSQFQVLGKPGGAGAYEFTPVSSSGAKYPKHENKMCQGVDLRTYDINKIYETRTLDLSFLMEALLGENSQLITSASFFDKLAGGDALRRMLSENKSEQEIRNSWEADLQAFKKLRELYLMY